MMSPWKMALPMPLLAFARDPGISDLHSPENPGANFWLLGLTPEAHGDQKNDEGKQNKAAQDMTGTSWEVSEIKGGIQGR